MAPDLNSLPPSQRSQNLPHAASGMHSTSIPNRQDSSSPRGSTSLAAAASMNAADRSRRSSASQQNRSSPRLDRITSDRRRSQVSNTFSLNDPTLPSPGELVTGEHRPSFGNSFSAASPTSLGGRGTIATGDPHHQRQPSLGDIHNELEQEQEAQVNRMLQMIRLQQQQLDVLQRSNTDTTSGNDRTQHHHTSAHSNNAIADEPTPGSERSFSFQQRPHSMSRTASSANRSPALGAMPSYDAQHPLVPNYEWIPPPSPLDSTARRNSNRDESAYYQAETANLTRENQMLKLRIRELEKQLAETTGSTVRDSETNSPALPSNLVTSPVIEGEE